MKPLTQLAKNRAVRPDVGRDVAMNVSSASYAGTPSGSHLLKAGSCLRNGWPSHCDRTMACDSVREEYELTPAGRAAIDPTEGA